MIIIGQKQCKIKVKSTPFLPALKGGVSWSFSDESKTKWKNIDLCG
jgi:hypothetical protein